MNFKNISYYRGLAHKGQPRFLPDVMSAIKSGVIKDKIEELRSLDHESNEFEDKKKMLPGFTPSGQFNQSRKLTDLVNYNPVIVLDIDHVGDKAPIIRDKAAKISYTWSAFISPGGEGVKILVKADSTVENHQAVYLQLADHYSIRLGVDVDKSGKDVTRVCFMSWDPDLFLNEESDVFHYQTVTPHDEFRPLQTTLTSRELFDYTVDFTEKKIQYVMHNRNNFIHLLANNLNRAGMDEHTAESFISSTYTDSDIVKQIPGTVRSAYSHTNEHGKYRPENTQIASFERLATSANSKSVNNTPTISDELYARLPKFFQECTSVFDVRRERDIFFTGMLTILSGCFNSVEGKYDGRTYSPNLFSFTIAGPGSGKGVMGCARHLGSEIHYKLKFDFVEPLFSDTETDTKTRWFFIPADSSAAAIKRMLVANSEQGTICEAEADSLSGALSQDWGGFDDLLRKSFQHEPVTTSRMDKNTNDVILSEINRPKLSVCLTGTPGQVFTLLKSTENGLFSRFLFYTFHNEEKPVFKDVFADDEGIGLDEYFADKAKEVYEMFRRVNEVGKCSFTLDRNQKKTFRQKFDVMLKQFNRQYGEETQGIVLRLGLITFRIAMILTVIRSLDERVLPELIVCCNDDYRTAMELSEIYLEHSMTIFQSLPGSKQINPNAMALLNFLPAEFTYSQAEQIGTSQCGISGRSTSNHLKMLLNNKLLSQPMKNGAYFRSEMR